MDKDKPKNKLAFFKTLVMMLVVLAMIIFFLNILGVLDNKSGDALNIANNVCFLTGHPDGMDDIVKVKDDYVFNCSNVNISISYNQDTNTGYLVWIKE